MISPFYYTQIIDPPDFGISADPNYRNTSHLFVNPLIAKVVRLLPICDGLINTHECSVMKVQLYGVPYITRELVTEILLNHDFLMIFGT